MDTTEELGGTYFLPRKRQRNATRTILVDIC